MTDNPEPAVPIGKPPSILDTTAPHSARVWNYWLGGTDNFEADRRLGDQVREVFPGVVEVARVSRAFLVRAVTLLAGERGVRQFLDIGTGLPSADNTHEVAQRIAPESRIVYVDNDPLVLMHARELLASSPGGVIDYLDADVHEPDKIVRGAARTLDFDQPIALMMLGILGNVLDYDRAREIVARLVDALPSGSYLVVNDGTNVVDREAKDAATKMSFEAGTPYVSRSPAELTRFFDGLELLEPGVVSTPRWRPGPGVELPDEVDVFCGVARKP
ncbi:SAM-dependent methyltransferase [Plantactinospora solaniradicis]|uniref:SAM-dependent methyltransferase n=1 Tax=Plantactinospora solaniradicis TaxID=1723736 RepID=A0ABW1KI02_9ACTN